MAKKSPLRAIPLDCRAVAKYLGCSYQTVVRITGDMARGRRRVWAFQGYGVVIWLRPKSLEGSRQHRQFCRPQFYLSGRHAAHRIGGAPGRKRWHWRQGSQEAWFKGWSHLVELAHGQMIRVRMLRRDDKHKGSPFAGTGGGPETARPPPTANRPGLRRWKGLAAQIASRYSEAGFPRANHFGWSVLRLNEWHSAADIEAALAHAALLLPRQARNPAAWIAAVAARRLDADGLAPAQRRRRFQEAGRQRASRAALKVSNAKIQVDADGVKWQHLGGSHWEKL